MIPPIPWPSKYYGIHTNSPPFGYEAFDMIHYQITRYSLTFPLQYGQKVEISGEMTFLATMIVLKSELNLVLNQFLIFHQFSQSYLANHHK